MWYLIDLEGILYIYFIQNSKVIINDNVIYFFLILGHCVYLKPNHETVFGRKKGDVILSNDTSISREHALINVTQLSDITVLQKMRNTFNCILQ